MKKKLTIPDLNAIISQANTNYSQKAPHGLDDAEFKALCWIEAVVNFLRLDIEIEYPYTPIIEPDDF